MINRNMSPKVYFYHEGDNCLTDQFGYVVTKEEYDYLLSKVGDFYKEVEEEEIIQYNENHKIKVHQGFKSFSEKSKEDQKATKGYVYFIRADGKYIKIGCTSNLKERFKSLKIASPNELELCFYIETDHCKLIEKEMHDYFSNYKMRGEWFDIHLLQISKWANEQGYTLTNASDLYD